MPHSGILTALRFRVYVAVGRIEPTVRIFPHSATVRTDYFIVWRFVCLGWEVAIAIRFATFLHYTVSTHS